MIELPEAAVLAAQINKTLKGKTISSATAAASPHKFAWYFGEPKAYPKKLVGKTITEANQVGGFVKILADDTTLLFGDGVNLRYAETPKDISKKHQLLLEFTDGSALCASVQMYGGLWCFSGKETFDNKYYLTAQKLPSPLSKEFNEAYFTKIATKPEHQKLSAKALLATEQRIPGLGNGVLQDILYNAKLHPKRKISTFSKSDITNLFNSIKSTLFEMVAKGGRDTEKDLFGNEGGYITKLSRNTVGKPCPKCKGKS